MFKMEENHEFDWPVVIQKPVGVDERDEPKYEEHRIVVRFRAMTIDAFLGRGAAGGRADEDGEADTRPPLIRATVGWKPGNVCDEHGAAVPFSEAALQKLIDIPYVGTAFTDAYLAAISGRARKN